MSINITRSQIRKVAEETRKLVIIKRNKLWPGTPLNLGGICYYATILLCQKLKEAGFPTLTVMGSGHWYCKVNNWLVDITASQFGQGKICIRDFNATQEKIKKGEVDIHFWRAKNIGDYGDTCLLSYIPRVEEVFNIKIK